MRLVRPDEPGEPTIAVRRGESVPFVYLIVLLAGGGAAYIGFTELSPATSGVGYVGLGCFLAIVARVVQAEVHNKLASERRRSDAGP